MRRAALLVAVPLLVASCGNDRVELKADGTLDGRVERPDASQVAREIRALSAQRVVVRLGGGRALETRNAGFTWHAARWSPATTTIRPAVALPRGARGSQVCRSAFFDLSHGLLICGGVPGAGNQWKTFWSWDGTRWTKLADGPSYGYVGELDALGPRAYVHHSGRAGDLITTDGGRTWRSAIPPESSTIGSWVTPQIGWALTGRGDIFRTLDGGEHWRYIAPSFWPVGETSFCTPRIGYGTGTPNVSGYSADRTVYGTIDGGRTWTRRSYLKLGAGTLTCVGRDEVLLSAYPPINARRQEPVFLRSHDGGRHWRGLRVPRGAYPPQVQSRNVYFAVATDNEGWITLDGARTWRRIRPTADELQSVAFVSREVGFAVALRRIGPKRIRTWLVRTTDGGRTWRRLPSKLRNFRPTSVTAAQGTLWVHSPQRVLRTADGGSHWDEIRISVSPAEARFASPTLGVVPGSRALLVTRDGGVTWRWLSRGPFYS